MYVFKLTKQLPSILLFRFLFTDSPPPLKLEPSIICCDYVNA